MLHSDCKTARSADSRLVSSPVRRSVKYAGDRRIRWANRSSRSRAITRSAVDVEDVHLHEIHRALDREQAEESQREPVEQVAAVLLERRIHQVPDDRWENQAGTRRGDEAQGRDGETPRVGTEQGQQSRERLGRRNSRLGRRVLSGRNAGSYWILAGRLRQPCSRVAVDCHGRKKQREIEQGVLVHRPRGRRANRRTPDANHAGEQNRVEHHDRDEIHEAECAERHRQERQRAQDHRVPEHLVRRRALTPDQRRHWARPRGRSRAA